MTNIWSKFCLDSPAKRSSHTRAPRRPAAPELTCERKPDRLAADPLLRRDLPPCQAWELPKPRQPLPKPQSSRSDLLASFPNDVLTKITQSLSAKDVLGLAAASRTWRLHSRDPMFWTAERLSGLSAFSLGTLPADILEFPAVRAVRFAAQAAEAIASGDDIVLRSLCTHPFAGVAQLDHAAQALVANAYDALAVWHFECQWIATKSSKRFLPHSEVRQRAAQLYLTGSATAVRVFADGTDCLPLAAKFLSGPSHATPAGTQELHRFFAADLTPIAAVAERLDKSPEHASARKTFFGIIPGDSLKTSLKVRQEARELCLSYPWLRLASNGEHLVEFDPKSSP